MFSSTGSSQSRPCIHRSCNKSFGVTINGDTNPSGSKIEKLTLRIPRLEIGASFTTDLNVKTSLIVFQEIPNTRSSLLLSISKETVGETSDGGSASRTFGQLLMNFVNRKPLSLKISINCFAKLIAADSESTDFKQSST